MKLILGFIALVAVLAALGVGFWYMDAAYWAKGSGKTVEVEIKPGMSALAAASVLAEKHVIASEFAFRLYLKLHGGSEKFQSGIFQLEEGSPIVNVVAAISSPLEAKEKILRVIEGWNLHDIAKEVERLGIGTQEEFLKLTGKPATDYRAQPQFAPTKDWSKDFPLLADKPKNVSLEGYLFPDTYRLSADAKSEDVIKKLLQEFTKKFDENMMDAASEQKKSVFEIVTMASIIEREVNGATDRAKVADMLWRRNDINWALQCDSTVKYATGKFGDTPFTQASDRASQSLYNTYQHYGLPLGPISNPGLVSLKATLHPMKNEANYFLTTPDGEVKYAKTLEEHTANKRYMR